MNSKGIDIAINQIVILIIGIVILSLGFAFLYKVFFAAQDQLPSLDARLEAQIEDSLRKGGIVELPANTKTIGYKDLAVFNLGIRNDPAITKTNNVFSILISYKLGKCSGTLCEQDWIANGILAPQFEVVGGTNLVLDEVDIGPGQSEIFTFGVSPKGVDSDYKARGQYFFNVCVFNSASAPISTCDAASYAGNTNGNYDFKTFSVIIE